MDIKVKFNSAQICEIDARACEVTLAEAVTKEADLPCVGQPKISYESFEPGRYRHGKLRDADLVVEIVPDDVTPSLRRRSLAIEAELSAIMTRTLRLRSGIHVLVITLQDLAKDMKPLRPHA